MAWYIFALLPALCGSAPVPWIDMSYPFDNETIYWPTVNSFEHKLVFANFTSAGFYYSSYDFSAAEHGGTHLDAPAHFAQGKWTTDQIPLDRLIGPAIVVDISAKAAKDPDAQVLVEDLKGWEEKHDKIPDDAILLVYSGWGKFWPNRKKYLGTDTKNTSILHFPGIHPNASRWLVQNRKIKAFGIDTASVDYGQSRDFQSHQILFEKNIPALENVANLDRLPAKGATVYAAPMFIRDGSGGPCRIFARIEDADPIDPKSGVEMIRRNVFLLGMVVLLALMLHP